MGNTLALSRLLQKKSSQGETPDQPLALAFTVASTMLCRSHVAKKNLVAMLYFCRRTPRSVLCISCVLAFITFVKASRSEEGTDQLDLDVELDLGVAGFSSGRRPARITEKFSPEEIQGQLLKFLQNSRLHGWPKITHPNQKENQFIRDAAGTATPILCKAWPQKRQQERDAEASAARFEALSIKASQAHDQQKTDQQKAKKIGNKKLKNRADKARIRFNEINKLRNQAASKIRHAEVKKVSAKTECMEQVGCLVQNLTDACEELLEMEPQKGRSADAWTICSQSVKDIFFHGFNVVRAWQVGRSAGSVPKETKSLWTKGDVLQRWIVPLATSVKASILWAGFWTDASDLEGHRSRTSKENLKHFADLIETQTVHPSTKLGQMVEAYDNLADCQGPVINGLKANMWSLFSFSFVAGMRKKKQDMVVVLVHKNLEGKRKLSDSILSQYEIPSIGTAAWGLGFWSPQLVVIDLLGNCKSTGPVLRQQLYSRLARSSEETKFQDAQDFVRRSKLSWTCLDCFEKRCNLDHLLAEQVKDILQAKRKEDEKGAALMKVVKDGEVKMLEKLLNSRADVNFQDEDGNTALFLAAKGGDMAIAELLLKRGADVNARNSGGKTPLFKARSAAIVKLLLDNGANRSALSLKGKTAKILKDLEDF